MVREPHTRSRTSAATELAAIDGAVDLARDRELVEACQAGDETAFAELYSRYHRRLLRFCLRRLHATDDAEEAAQEAFTRAWRALPRFGGDRRFYPWLTVIAGNVCTDMLRRRSRVVPLDDMPLQAGDTSMIESEVDERLLLQVDMAMATEALGHLSDRHQRVLRLREATEWTSQRIAEHEGVAVPAVDTLLWRARQAFKREFAALSDAGGLAAAVGVGAAALRRAAGRVGTRMATLASFPTRSPGTLVATVAVAGVAVAGGGAAFVAATSQPAHVAGAPTAAVAASAPAAGAPGTGSSAAASGPAASWAAAARAAHAGTGATDHAMSRPASGTSASGRTGSTGGPGARGGSPLATVGGPGSAVSGVTGVTGQVVGTGVAAVGEALGLGHPTVLGTLGTGTTGAAATAGNGGSTVITTVGGAAGTVTTAVKTAVSTSVKTAVSGGTGTTTTLGSAAKTLLG